MVIEASKLFCCMRLPPVKNILWKCAIKNHSLRLGPCYTSSARFFHQAQPFSSEVMQRVYVTRNIPPIGLQLLKSAGVEVTQWNEDDPVPREELLKQVAGIDGLFCLLTDRIDAELLDASGVQLKVVGTMSVGYDHINLQECSKRGIPVGYTPDVLTHATAELTVSLLLATSRHLIEGATAVKDGTWGTWKPMWLCGPSLQNSTVGIFGFGRIGQQVAECLSGFSVKEFLYCSRDPVHDSDIAKKARKVSFDELLGKSDFVVACCSLTEETRGIFNKAAFGKMKSTAIFINTSRGPVVDQDDLYSALISGEIAAAGIDVTVPEPLPIHHKLLKVSNCVVLPHIGSATNEARSAMSEICAKNIIAALQGEPMPAQIK